MRPEPGHPHPTCRHSIERVAGGHGMLGRASRPLMTIPPPFLSFMRSFSASAVILQTLVPEPPPSPPPLPVPARDEQGDEGGCSDATQVLRTWGCSDDEVSRILTRQPSVARMKPRSLHSKLQALRCVGLRGPDLVRIVSCRPRFLAGRIADGLDARLAFLRTLFHSNAHLIRAVVRNPSLLNYDVDRTMRPCITLYESVGVGRYDLGRVLLSRPTAICRSALDDEKRELIHRTGLPMGAATYKYAVSVLAVSHLETIREKVANLEKFGFLADQVLALFGRNPNLLTLSVDKVQRNMTYVVGTMKLPALIILEQPFLVFANLDMVLKPRFLLAGKLQEMELEPQVKGPHFVRALRMTEARFLRRFVDSHEKKVAEGLRKYYHRVKGVKRLAEASKSVAHKGFPF